MTPDQRVHYILDLYRQYGSADYIGEPVSQIEHMCQCAELAEAAGSDDEMILAAFFHDIGHLYEHISGQQAAHMDQYGTVDHETLGAQFVLQMGFSPRVASLVGSHVAAKRYLTATDPAYYNRLSEASQETLRQQGGPMSAAEIKAFEADPLHNEYVQLRLWDEAAKLTHKPLPPLEKYGALMLPLLTT